MRKVNIFAEKIIDSIDIAPLYKVRSVKRFEKLQKGIGTAIYCTL